MNNKQCTKCKEIKSLDEFNRDRSSKSGYKYSCRECDRIAKAEYRSKNKDKIKAYNKKYSSLNKDRLRVYAIKNKEKIRERCKQYRLEHREEVLEQERRRRILNKIKNFHKTFERKLIDIRRKRFRENHPEYDRLRSVWSGMKARCRNPNHKWYRCYGGKGVEVCKEWMNFEAFYEWSINNGYAEGLTIDRIENDGNYCPENCRYVTMKVNNRNRGYVKLDEHKVSIIKYKLINGISNKMLAQEYYVSHTTIRDISIGRYWSDVAPANSII